MASIGATCCAPLPPGKKRRRPKGQRREARPGGYAGLIGLLFPAASADPGGRDQGLVRRTCATRHLEVRHWITSFPLLHLEAVMPSRATAVKAFSLRHARRHTVPAAQAGQASRSPAAKLMRDMSDSYPKSCLDCRSPTARQPSKTAELRHFLLPSPVRFPTDMCPMPVRFLRHLSHSGGRAVGPSPGLRVRARAQRPASTPTPPSEAARARLRGSR
jgi:hypothetical protein